MTQTERKTEMEINYTTLELQRVPDNGFYRLEHEDFDTKESSEQAALLDEFLLATNFGEGMRRHFRARAYFIRLSKGEIFEIDKPRIQTEFCCGEDDRGQGGDGPGTMAYALKVLEANRTERGFKAANLRDFDDCWLSFVGRRATKDRYYDGVPHPYLYLRPAYMTQGPDGRVLGLECIMPGTFDWQLLRRHEFKRPEGSRDVTDDDIELIRAGYARVRSGFQRRLNAYWKRFGASKIKTLTYWTEQ